jgi:glycine/D-amino acid oxidase-like deaminating enzyme
MAVILGTAPYTPEFGYMTDRVLPTITYASITRRLTERELALYKGRLNWGLTPADAAGTTLRMTADARLLIRNLCAFAPRYQAKDRHLVKARKAHREGLDARFPQFSGVPLPSTWGGVVSLSRNQETFFGEMAPGVYSSNCYNGVGMIRGSISGKLLADLATGNYSQQLEDMISVSGMPSRIPPDPIRSMGVSARFKLAEWESQDEV